VGKELCEIDHELVALYNAKFGLRRLLSQNRCPTRRQLQQVTSLTLNTNDADDKKILDLLSKRKDVEAKEINCVDKKGRFLRLFKKMDEL